MDADQLFHAFGFKDYPQSALISIHPYAPVYRVENEQGAWIIKRGRKPFALAQAVTAWTDALSKNTIPVVTPAPGFSKNPMSFQSTENDEEVWVVYPFIQGTPYRCELQQIRQAGELLGRIHAFNPQQDFSLKIRRTVECIEEADLVEDISAILERVKQFYPQDEPSAQEILHEKVGHYLQSALPRMLSMELPLANCSWDYKAANLVFEPCGRGADSWPVLIDPDNAGRIPRLCDLAIAALLFHNDGIFPGRLLTQSEWMVFLSGYRKYICFTADELAAWQDVLLCTWVDEGLWLLNGSPEDWAHPRQGSMQRDLLFADLSGFVLK